MFKFLKKKNKPVFVNGMADWFFKSKEDNNYIIDIQTFYNNPIVRQCLDLIFSAVQRVPLVLYKNGRETEGIEKILTSAKINEDSLISFKQKLLRNYILYGYSQMVVMRKDIKTEFDAVKLLDTKNDAYAPVYDQETDKITYYENNEGEIIPSFDVFKQTKRPKVLYFLTEWKNFSLFDNGYQNNSYINVLSSYIDTMKALSNRANSLAKGVYNTKHIISINNSTIDEEKDLAEKLQASKRNDSMFIVNGVDFSIHTIDNTISNIFDKISTDDIKRTIAGVFGIPVALISPASVDGAKYSSNYEESRVSFYEDTIIPKYLAPLQEFLSNALFPEEYQLRFDLNSIDCLREKRISFYTTIDKVSFLTDEEKRKLAKIT